MAALPVRCFTCGKILLGDKYFDMISEEGANKDFVLDSLGYRRMCCRRMFLGHSRSLEKNILLYTSSKSGKKK